MTRVAESLQPMGSVECAMVHIPGEDRSQLLLLPDAVDDCVGPDNPVRFIDASVSGLDFEAAGFERVRSRDRGRPDYDPAKCRLPIPTRERCMLAPGL
ncbi:MAG: hypothetical protein OXC14_13180, partial [Rhodospirillaceae bacterium]|nr:hypothetical protein [Rhodospirillaceae bacterium]